MKIQKGLVWRRSTNELIGFADTDLWESNLNDGCTYRGRLATHATQFYITTVDGKYHAPVAYLFTRDNKKGKDMLMAKMVHDGIRALHLAGFEVTAVSTDNAGENRKCTCNSKEEHTNTTETFSSPRLRIHDETNTTHTTGTTTAKAAEIGQEQPQQSRNNHSKTNNNKHASRTAQGGRRGEKGGGLLLCFSPLLLTPYNYTHS